MKYDLRSLRHEADIACHLAEGDDDSYIDAVNWADLSCVEAGFCVNDGGDEYYYVKIEEADPAAYHLREFISNWLKERGYDDVVVRTEW